MIRITFLITLVAQLNSCHHINEDISTEVASYALAEAFDSEYTYEISPPLSSAPSQPQNNILKYRNRIIKHGAIRLQVEDLHVAKDKVNKLVNRNHAYYGNEEYQSHSDQLTYTLKIRVPNTQFDTFIQGIENGIGDIKSKSINIQDVTEEYSDNTIRLENKLAYLNKYKEILKKATSVKGIIEVQDKIRYIEVEIESKKGRLKYLDDQIRYSTLQLTLYEDISIDIASSLRFGTRLLAAIDYGISLFTEFVIAIVSLWPLLVVLLVVFIFRKPVLSSFTKA